MAHRIETAMIRALGRVFEHGPLARFGTHDVAQSTSLASLIEERAATVPAYHALFSEFADFTGQRVMELGCSRGYLLKAFLDVMAFEAIGVDRDARALADGQARYGEAIRFVQSDDHSIPLPDASCDVAYTVDVVEHLSQPAAMFREVHRVLRRGGRFLIYFHPWLGPYGAHLGDILPFPWPHVFFRMEALYAVAAERYERAADKDLSFVRFD